jgi:type II secretory pathway pseudopilin PulG
MEIVILLSVIFALASSVLGVWLGVKYYALRLLALEKQTELAFTCMEDRVSELARVANRDQKREAVNTRWKKRDVTDADTLKELDKVAKDLPGQNSIVGYDPNTWMNGR